MLIGKKIEKMRKDRELSFRKLADLSGIPSHSYIRNIENGTVLDPALSTIMKLAKGLEATVSELLIDVEIPNQRR